MAFEKWSIFKISMTNGNFSSDKKNPGKKCEWIDCPGNLQKGIYDHRDN